MEITKNKNSSPAHSSTDGQREESPTGFKEPIAEITSNKSAFEWVYDKTLLYYTATVVGLLGINLLGLINLKMFSVGVASGLFLSLAVIGHAFFKFIKD